MTVAIVLSTYNGEKYIIEQLQSLLEQSRVADRVYISDDRSTDKTVELVKEFIDLHNLKTWELSINETNKGWKANFKALVLSAKEDIIFLCDQDDIWYPDKIKDMMSIIESNDSIDLLACGYDAKYDDNTRHITKRITRHMKNSKSVTKIQLSEKCMDVLRPGCAMAVKSSFCKRIEKEWNELLPHDAMIWRCAVLNGSAYIYDHNLFAWRRYNSSSSNPNKNKQTFNSKYEMLYDFYVGNCKSHLLYLECAEKLYQKGEIKNDDYARSILDSSQRCETEILSSYQKKSVSKYLMNAIKFWKYMPSVKTVMWNAYVIIKSK